MAVRYSTAYLLIQDFASPPFFRSQPWCTTTESQCFRTRSFSCQPVGFFPLTIEPMIVLFLFATPPWAVPDDLTSVPTSSVISKSPTGFGGALISPWRVVTVTMSLPWVDWGFGGCG